MPLSPGTRLGHYDVTALLGESGMGQVWQATDTQLNRQVALKILPDAFAADPDRLARFKREAQILASLNHPNIAAIYGIEEAKGTRALVLELVEGPTLADRISKGPIPLDEALPIAKQIAEALEAAHEAGVIHRDLKPANIKVREDGTVKVLDFGLAKALDPTPTSDPSESPTLTAAATQMGVIMGTAAYMSPEQAKGKTADRRSDVWAFGAVLYEMLAGRRAFRGEDVSDTLVSVFRDDPDWSRLSDDVPARVRQAVQVCLQKDLKQRVRDIAAVRLAMEGAFETTVSAPTEPAVAPTLQVWQRPVPALAIALLLVAIAGLAVWSVTRPEPTPAPDLMRFTIVPPDTAPLDLPGTLHDLAISPDGTQVVYQSGGAGRRQLNLRPINQLVGAPIASVEDGFGPFFSPDNAWIGFTASGGGLILRKVSIFGGAPLTLTEAPGLIRGASWGTDDQIIFGTIDGGLFRVSGGGGEPETLTILDTEQGESSHTWPFIIRDREAVLFVIATSAPLTTGQLAVLDLRTGDVTRLGLAGVSPHYVSTGHLVYAAEDNSLRAVPFDATSLEVTGNPVPLVEDVVVKASGAANFGISDNGRLAYVAGSATGFGAQRSLVWVDREGREEPIAMPPRPYSAARLSPDGTRVAVEVRDENTDIWVHDLERGTQTRLTFDPGVDRFPVWTPDGERIAFASNRANGLYDVFWKLAVGTGQPELVVSDPDRRLDAGSWTPDGQSLPLIEAGIDIGIVTLDGDQTRQPVLEEDFPEGSPEVSPDGRWMAYRSAETGRTEIYVRPFPDVGGGKWQVSTEGGIHPAWSPDGRELFYRQPADGAVMGVTVETEPTFSPGIPEPVIEGDYVYAPGQGRNWDISPDGQRFLMLKNVGESGAEAPAAPQINVVINWFEELKARVPTN